MEAVYSPETLVSTYKSTWRYNPEDKYRHLHRRENLESPTSLMLSNEAASLPLLTAVNTAQAQKRNFRYIFYEYFKISAQGLDST
jgi:hypothetical protein